ncbi:multidrug resistance-associated protein 5 [Tanacetum coccineum]
MIHGTDLHCFDVHNDGYFFHLPLTYVDGVILEMIVRRMPYEEFVVYLEEKVSDDMSLSYMFDVEETFGRLNLYLDHLDIDLSKYLSQAITYDMDACVSKIIGLPKKRYCNEFSLDGMVDWAEMEVEKPKGVETRTSTTEVDATDGVEARTSTIEVDATDGVNATDKGKEKDGITEDPFISVEKHVERFPMLVKSMEARVVAKCGQRKPRLSDPEKGKQRNQTMYPNGGSSDELPTCPWRCYASSNQCTHAKKYALTEYEKEIDEHYAMLRSYEKLILDFNPGSTVKLGVTMNPDGKLTLIGEMLTEIGRDRNNHIYPVAWAVVNVENKDNWTWFLELLEHDLGSSGVNGLTLMSDQHKGLMEAVKDAMPNAEHMQCARHIYENFKKQYLRLEFR